MGSMTDARTCADCPADISHRGNAAKRCAECQGAKRRNRRKEDPRYRAQQQARDRRRAPRGTPKQRSEAVRRYRQRHPDRVKAQRPPPEKSREYARRWRAKHPERALEISRAFRARHIERIRSSDAESHRRWRKNNPEKSRARVRAWQQNNPDKVRVMGRKSSARYRNLVGGKPRRWLPDAIARQDGICTWCSLPLPDDLSAIHADHIYPASRGGETSPENTAALHAFCNLVKGDRLVA